MSEFKVGDRVRIIENGFEGTIEEISKLELQDYHENFNSGRFYYGYRVVSNYKYYNNIESDMLELIERAKEPTSIEELEQRIEKLEKEVFNPLTIKDSIKKSLEENLEISLKPSLLTEDERVILRNLNECWKWIVRDEKGFLTAWGNKPYGKKKGKLVLWCHDTEFLGISLPFNDNILKFIKNKDEPYNIEELLKGECGNDN